MTSTRSNGWSLDWSLGWSLIASIAMVGALASCTSTHQPEPASSAGQTLIGPMTENFSSFDEASEILKKVLNERGYDTSQGDHPVGNAESYLASLSSDNSTDIRVNTSWDKQKPIGSYTVLNNTIAQTSRQSSEPTSILGIARLDAKGVWTECKGFQFELLSTNAENTIAQLLVSIRNQMGC